MNWTPVRAVSETCPFLRVEAKQVTGISTASSGRQSLGTTCPSPQHFSADLLKPWVLCWSNHTTGGWNEPRFVVGADALGEAPRAWGEAGASDKGKGIIAPVGALC